VARDDHDAAGIVHDDVALPLVWHNTISSPIVIAREFRGKSKVVYLALDVHHARAGFRLLQTSHGERNSRPSLNSRIPLPQR
jgi:hypothetical protein